MLRRNSAKVERRPLCRSRSTGSVARNPVCDLVSIEPVDAQRDAQIAALRSFHKANSNADNREKRLGMIMPPNKQVLRPIPRSHSFTNGPDVIDHARTSNEDKTADTPKDDGIQRRQSVRFAGPNARPKKDPALRAQGALSDNTGLLCRPRESLYIKSHDRPATLINTPRDGALVSGCDPNHQGFDRALTRTQGRLRKSQSMFNTSLPSFSDTHNAGESVYGFSTWNSVSLPPPLHTGIESERLCRQQFRAPKSMSFLRLHSGKGLLGGHRNSGSLNLGRSRPNLLDDKNGMKRRPSLFFRPKNKRTDDGQGHASSLQSRSSHCAPNTSAISSETPTPKKSGLRGTARKVSKSVRCKIRGMFGRSKNSNTTSSDGANKETDTNSYQGSDLSTHDASLSRVQSHVPSLHSVSSNPYLCSRQGSLESVELGGNEVDGEKSRVTSWTNSSMHTALDYGQDGEWEPQRLSVIDEGINLQSSQRWQTATGNERIYSALVKRLDDMSKQQTSENHTESTHGTQDSEALSHGKHDTRSSFYTRDDDDVFRNAEKSPQFCCSGTQPVSLDEAVTKWKAETASAGPPGSPETVTSVSNYLFRTQSPYKRALRQSINASNEEQHRAINVRYLSSLSALSLPTRRPTPDNTEGDFRLTSAESVYSRSSDNETILLGHNQEGEQQPQDIGAEVLCDNGSSSPTQAHLREVSSASSVEWKTWLSANVSKLEAGTGSKEFADAQAWNPWITIGHVREQAEIEPILCQSRLSSQASISSCDYIDNAETMKTDSPKQNAKQHAKPTFSEAAPQ